MLCNARSSKYTRLTTIIVFLFFVILSSSCKKWLAQKPDQSLTVPSNLNDLQAILDNQKGGTSPGYIDLVSDDYYVPTNSWLSANPEQRLSYIWDRNARIVFDHYSWSRPYAAIYEANFVLDQLSNIGASQSDQVVYNSIQGTALFCRAFQFYHLSQLYCKPYSSSAATDLGIVLKLTSLVTEGYTRSTVQQTYEQVISDLKTAAELLPVITQYATRPNKAAAYGALARVYLSMRDYINAEIYADLALGLNNTLLDYNSLTPINSLPVNYISNPEVLFLAATGVDILGPSGHPTIDSNLYQTYSNNDLRKKAFFGNYTGGDFYWKGSYYAATQYYTTFTGIAIDEIYLIQAECRARRGNKDSALSSLNTLLRKRYDSSFIDVTAIDATDALGKILIERRKELLFRGLRWTDLRRLNLESANITLKRIIDGITYTLPPNDLRWVLLIPDIEINRSGISQNPR